MRWWPLVGALVLGWVGPARADGVAGGVCVTIDVSRDNLGEVERGAIRIAIQEALASEGIPVDREGFACRGLVLSYSTKLGNPVTTTIIADGQSVSGRASSLDEVDLLVRQLVRSLVTGRSLATGFGVTDRTNVLRDQTAPRRADPSDGRRWDPVLAVGGGMLQLPPAGGRGMQRQYNIVAIESRLWGFITGDRSALEAYARVLLHDYGIMGDAVDDYREARDRDDRSLAPVGRGFGVMFSPFAVANYDAGLGFVSFLGAGPPRPFVRLGATSSLLLRLTDPEHRIDLGFGGYAGIGLQLSRSVNLSIAANVSNPVFHDFADTGYWYFLTTTAMLEIRGSGNERTMAPRMFRPEPVPTLRRINESLRLVPP